MTHDRSDVFLLNPNHADYLSGARPTLTDGSALGLGLRIFLVVACVGYLALSVTGVVWMGFALGDWFALNSRGLTATGELTERSTELVSLTEPGRPAFSRDSRVYYWHYRYDALGGSTYEGRTQVTEATYDDYRRGRSVEVIYLENRPEVSRIFGENTLAFPRMLVFAGGGNGLMSLVLGLVGWREFRRERRYRRVGRVIEGQVVKPVLKVGESEGKQTATLYLNYSLVSPATGEVLHRITEQRRNDLIEADLPAAGDPLAVLYVSDRQFKVL